jgi:RNA polymerase sigma factor (sigma-70 family)
MHTGTATHTTLLARLADGTDPSAWVEFHARYGDLIRGYCARRGLQPADGDDVLQDVLLSLNKAMPNFRYDPGKGLFRSYLKTVVQNAISHRWRQKSAAGTLSHAGSVADAVEPEEHWEAEWRRYHFRRAMRVIESEFSERDVRAFEMYAIDGREVREAAAEAGMSVDAVYQAKSRLLRRLTQVIEAQVAEEG